MSRKQTSSDGDTFQRMSIVDSGLCHILIGITCFDQNRQYYSSIKHHPGYSDRHWHRGRRHGSRVLHQRALRSMGHRWEDCNELGYSCSWPSGKTRRLSKGENVIECKIEHFVPTAAVAQLKAVPSIEFLPAKGNLELEKEVEDTTFDLVKSFTKVLQERDASSSTGSDPQHEVVKEKIS